jgi:hypothetical protein
LDSDRLLIDLKQVNRQIERVEDHIARQRRIIAELKGQTGFALTANELLDKFRILQAQHLDRRKRLLMELGNEGGETAPPATAKPAEPSSSPPNLPSSDNRDAKGWRARLARREQPAKPASTEKR